MSVWISLRSPRRAPKEARRPPERWRASRFFSHEGRQRERAAPTAIFRSTFPMCDMEAQLAAVMSALGRILTAILGGKRTLLSRPIESPERIENPRNVDLCSIMTVGFPRLP